MQQGGLAARARSLFGTAGESRHFRRQERANKRATAVAAGAAGATAQEVQGAAAPENGTAIAAAQNGTQQAENQQQQQQQEQQKQQQEQQQKEQQQQQQQQGGQVIPPQNFGQQVWVVNGQAVQLINGQLVAVNQNQLQMVQVVPIGIVSQDTVTQCRVVTVQRVQQANAVIVNGQVAVRLMMNLSSSFDHRFIDGYDAAETIQALKEKLEQPATIFIRD